MSSLTISITEIDLRCSPSAAFGLLEADFRRAGLAGGEERPGLAGQRRELARRRSRPGPPARRARTAAQRNRPARRSCRRAGACAAASMRARAARSSPPGRSMIACWFMCDSNRENQSRPRRDCSGFARQRKGCRLPSTSCGRRDVPMKRKKPSNIKAKPASRRRRRSGRPRRTTARSPRSRCNAANFRRRCRPISPSARRSSASCPTCCRPTPSTTPSSKPSSPCTTT